MIMYNTNQESPLDEVELALGLLKVQHRTLIIGKTYKEISQILNNKYNVHSTESQIGLLYEPTIDDMELDLRVQYEAMELYY